jgi:hypothetical protein
VIEERQLCSLKRVTQAPLDSPVGAVLADERERCAVEQRVVAECELRAQPAQPDGGLVVLDRYVRE